MISRGQMNLIRSLDRKKSRDEEGCFLAEGDKIVKELLQLPARTAYRLRTVYGLPEWIAGNAGNPTNRPDQLIEVSQSELDRISHLKTPNQVLAIVELPAASDITIDFKKDLAIGLDQVQDPGNAGTIIRLADWFGIDCVFFSPDSADIFAPKVIQASMGSIFRVKVLKTDLQELVSRISDRFPVYGTSLDGSDIYSADINPTGLILLGNESKGLDPRFLPYIKANLKIPSYSTKTDYSDSLNVAIAAAIICGEFRRRFST